MISFDQMFVERLFKLQAASHGAAHSLVAYNEAINSTIRVFKYQQRGGRMYKASPGIIHNISLLNKKGVVQNYTIGRGLSICCHVGLVATEQNLDKIVKNVK